MTYLANDLTHSMGSINISSFSPPQRFFSVGNGNHLGFIFILYQKRNKNYHMANIMLARYSEREYGLAPAIKISLMEWRDV